MRSNSLNFLSAKVGVNLAKGKLEFVGYGLCSLFYFLKIPSESGWPDFESLWQFEYSECEFLKSRNELKIKAHSPR